MSTEEPIVDPRDQQILDLQAQVAQLEQENADLKATPPKNPNIYEMWECFNKIAYTDPPQNHLFYREWAMKGIAYCDKFGGPTVETLPT